MFLLRASDSCCYLFLDCALQKEDPTTKPTISAHPARFSPDDKFSKERIITKKRFQLLPTQSPDPIFN